MYLIQYAYLFYLLYGEVIPDRTMNIETLRICLGYDQRNPAKNHCLDVLLHYILDCHKMFPTQTKKPFAEMPTWAWSDPHLLVILLFLQPRAIHTLSRSVRQSKQLLKIVARRVASG